MPRPTELTEAIGSRIVALIRAGCPGEVAAHVCEVPLTSYYRWMRLGKQGDEGPEVGGAGGAAAMSYFRFWQGVTRARGEAQAAAAMGIHLAGQRDWRASAFWLERTDPQRWGRSTKVEATIRGRVEHEHRLALPTGDVVAQVAERLLVILQRKSLPPPAVPQALPRPAVASTAPAPPHPSTAQQPAGRHNY